MKRFAICCVALAVAAMFVPAAQAGTKCYHLTNFCDGLEATNIFVGGTAGTITVGLWDWVCLANNTGTLVSGVPNRFGGQPLYPYSGGTGSGFSATFTFKPLTHLFDLYGTVDGMTTFAFQTSQPYTTTPGPCNPLVEQKNLPKATTVQ
jgi:hypothetical protein